MEKIGLSIEFPAPDGELHISLKRLSQIIEREKKRGVTHLSFDAMMDEHYFVGVILQPIKK